MPAVVYKQPSALKDFFSGLTGVFEGRLAGEEIAQKRDEFRQNMGLQQEQLAETKHEWDLDLEYRHRQLQQLAMDNQLNREQADRFAQMTNDRELAMQQYGFEFEKNFIQPFQHGENEADRAVRLSTNANDNRSARYATWQGHENLKLQVNAETTRINNEEGQPINLAQVRLAGRDYNTLSEADKALAIQGLTIDLAGGEARVFSAQPGDRPSAQEMAAKAAQAKYTLEHLPELVTGYTKKVQDLYRAKVESEQGFGYGRTKSGGRALRYATADETNAAIKNGTWNAKYGSAMLDPRSLTPDDNDLISKGLLIIATTAAASPQFNAEGISAHLLPETVREINKLVSEAGGNPELASYLENIAGNVLIPPAVGYALPVTAEENPSHANR